MTKLTVLQNGPTTLVYFDGKLKYSIVESHARELATALNAHFAREAKQANYEVHLPCDVEN